MAAPPLLSAGARRVLVELLEAESDDRLEDAEIACEGLQCWVGPRRTRRAVVNELLRGCFISTAPCGEDLERYGLNSDGRLAARDPSHWPAGLARP